MSGIFIGFLYGIAGMLIGGLATHFLSKSLARRTEHNQAVKEFINAFQEELTRLKLESPAVSIYDIIYHARIKHGKAKAIFSGYLKGYKLKKFKQAWFEYYTLTPIYPNKKKDKDEDIILLCNKIEKLLEFAKYK